MAGDQAGKTAFIGVGVMGETILAGLLRSGRPVGDFIVGVRRQERGDELATKYGVTVLPNLDAAASADTVVLGMKPQDLAGALQEIAPVLRPGQLLVSLAAGITTAFIETHVPGGVAVVRVMPNTPALVDEGMHALSAGSHCDEAHLVEAEGLLGATGKVVRIAEKLQNAATAVSGSGPAYIFYVVEAMIDAGVMLGLPRPLATELAVQTLYGSATMLRETQQHPTILREQVTSPGGTTAAALRYLEDHKVKAAFLSAMEACRDRAQQLAADS
ncbi:pyrroline-5-carboxylate reductase [Nocardioides jejuensis]|uniref:Pyrroline-5-carboxylate reductase n=1 Tax=Nocardioides jejuensis TaxID=2502782 RepID=A0A4R1C2U6_9ACTN|nr:pyrroline-5-carboxylate reductase [Nocardioides jejuensis]TCJ24338.1 pyrroline-5-carboxylate reductase [Nocardioides jejuensis]